MIQPQNPHTTMNLKNKLAAEFFGTFWLAPVVGAALAGIVYPLISRGNK